MSSVTSGRMTSDYYLNEQLVQENEQMIMELDILKPRVASLQQAVDALQSDAATNRDKILSLERENQCIREESDRLRTIVATRHEDDHRRVDDLVATSKATAEERLKAIEVMLQSLQSGVGTLLQRSNGPSSSHNNNDGGGNDRSAAVGATVADSEQGGDDAAAASLAALQAQLTERTQERDAALDRIQLIQAQWEAANSQAKQMSSERMTLQERAQQLLASSHVTGSAVSELVSEIFDIHEKETNEMDNKILIREILRNDDAQRHKQELEDLSSRHGITLGELNAEIARLTHTNNELNARIDRLLMMYGTNNIQSPLSTSTRGTAPSDDSAAQRAASAGAAAPASPDIHGPPSARRLVRRMTLTRSETGQLTARTDRPPSPGEHHHAADGDGGRDPHRRAVAPQEQQGSLARSHSMTTPQPAPAPTPPAAAGIESATTGGAPAAAMVLSCPRCTLNNAIDARRCIACELYLRSVQPTAASPSGTA